MNPDTDVDFDFFDTPRANENKTNLSKSHVEDDVLGAHDSEEPEAVLDQVRASKSNHGNRPRHEEDSKRHSTTCSSVRKIEAHIPTSQPTVISKQSSKDDDYSDSFDNYSTDCSDHDMDDEDSDIDYPARPRSGCKAPTPTSGRRGKRSGSSDDSLDSGDDNHPGIPAVKVELKQRNRHKKRHKSSEQTHSKQVTRGRSMAITLEKKDQHRSRSGGSTTASSDWLSDSDDSDVTDVSPLNTPRSGGRMFGKPPKNPTGKSPSSSRLEHLLQGNKDSMDLNLLMHAVLEMEKEQSEGLAPVPHKKFVVPPPGGCSKPPRKNFSFKNDHVGDIDRENQRLMKEIVKCAVQAKEAKQKAMCRASKQTPAATQKLTSSGVNRMKEQRRIEAENRAMLRRLQCAKPTKAVRHDEQLREYGKKTLFGTSVAAAHGLSAKKSPYGDGPSSCLRSHSMLDYHYDDDAHSAISSDRNSMAKARSRPSSAATVGNTSRSRPTSATSSTSNCSSLRQGGRKKAAPKPAWEEKW